MLWHPILVVVMLGLYFMTLLAVCSLFVFSEFLPYTAHNTAHASQKIRLRFQGTWFLMHVSFRSLEWLNHVYYLYVVFIDHFSMTLSFISWDLVLRDVTVLVVIKSHEFYFWVVKGVGGSAFRFPKVGHVLPEYQSCTWKIRRCLYDSGSYETFQCRKFCADSLFNLFLILASIRFFSINVLIKISGTDWWFCV